MDRVVQAASWLSLAVGACLAPAEAFADGWHNAALTTSSLDDWLSDVKQAIPDVVQRLSATELVSGQGLEAFRKRAKQGESTGGGAGRLPGRGGTIDSELTPHQRALLGRKAGDCLEALAFMKPENILPSEFPEFPMDKIPEYRAAAAKLLRMMGRPGAVAVAGELRSSLMGAGRAADALDTTLCDDYYDELLKVLKAVGDHGLLTLEDERSLRAAASGTKYGALAELSRKVQNLLGEIDSNTRPLPELIEFLAETRDGWANRNLQGRIRNRMPDASAQELLDFLQAKPPAGLRQAALAELEKRFAKSSVLELLEIQAGLNDPAIARRAADELASRSPKYAEVRDDLPAIIEFAKDDASPLSDPARRQLANAFQRAPIRDCLVWLGKSDEWLGALIWRQIEGRIARADQARRTLYRDVAFECLDDDAAGQREQRAACELLGRLDVSLVVGPLVEALPRFEREIWLAAGEVLRKLTGQDFGPRAGDGAGELVGEVRQWRAWLKEHPEGNGK